MAADMPDRSRVSRLSIPSTRTRDGRKVDTWTLDLPEDQRVTFDVTMHAGSDSGIHFEVSTGHPLFRHLDLRDDSLERLRHRLGREVEDVAEQAVGGTWKAGIIVESRTRLGVLGKTRRDASVSVSAEPVRFLSASSGSNEPTVRVVKGGVSQTVRQRAASETFPHDRSCLRNMDLSREASDPASRIVIEDTAEIRSVVDALQGVLARFGDLLGERLAPQRASAGLPDPQELIEMMRTAVMDPQREPDGEDPAFRS